MSRFLAASVSIAALLSGVTSAQRPRSDRAPLAGPASTAVIAGVVDTDASPEQPLRRVIVTLTGDSLATSLSTITDDAGRFVFESLPAGRFTVEAVKAAYLPMVFGAPHTGRPGVPISLAAGGREAVTIHLSRGAVITGTIQDDRGKPAVGAEVQVVDAQAPSRALPGTVQTDDRGRYRFYGLPAGAYFVAALPRQLGQGEIGERSTTEMDAILASLRQGSGHAAPLPAPRSPVTTPPSPGRTMNLAAVYFPGTPTFSGATPITVRSGEERSGIDFAIIPVATSEVSGVIRDNSVPLGDLQVMLTGDDGGPRLPSTTPETVGGGPTLSLSPNRDGRFTFTNVAPGHYILTARSRVGAAPASGANVVQSTPTSPPRATGEEWRYAQASVTVNDSDVSGVALVLGSGGVMSGRIVADASPGAPLPDLTKIRVDISVPSALPVFITGGPGIIGGNLPPPPEVTPSADGRFEVTGIAPNTYQLRVSVPSSLGSGWWPRSAMAGDRDLLDAPIPVALGQSLTGVVVTLTNRHTELTGTLQDPAGGPTSEFVIMVFPADRSLWISGSRRIQLAQPGTDGLFTIKDLPAGDYLVAALTNVDATALYEPSFLEEVAKQSRPVTIRDGGRTVQNLQIAR